MALSIDADLEFSVELPPAAGAPARRVAGKISGSGGLLDVTLDELPAFDRRGAPGLLRELARVLASMGLQVSIRDRSGLLVSAGAVRGSALARLFLRSRHVRLGRLAGLVGASRRRGRTPWSVRDLVPPLTLFPVLPTLGRQARRVTTTHDADGGGRPRFFFPGQANRLPGAQTQVFYLRVGAVTTIGSDPGSHLMLAGLEPQQAEIRRDEWDEYWVVSTGSTPVRVNGAPALRSRMRTGTRVQVGGWTMVYFRDEFADHGRPYGGRIGGELGHQIPQDIPQYRQPSPSPRPGS